MAAKNRELPFEREQIYGVLSRETGFYRHVHR